MPRTSLEVGDLVRLGKAGRPLAQWHGIKADMVMRVIALIPDAVYRRKAFQVACGETLVVAWPSQLRLLRPRRRPPATDDEG